MSVFWSIGLIKRLIENPSAILGGGIPFIEQALIPVLFHIHGSV